MADDESPAEVAYRLKNEQRCADLARELDAKLKPEGLAFCLVIATIDSENEQSPRRFSNTSYVSSCHREDAARLLTELLTKWWPDGTVTEPSATTCTLMREWVYKIRGTELGKIMTSARHGVREIIEATSAKDRAARALLLACEALAIFDVESRRSLPPRGN